MPGWHGVPHKGNCGFSTSNGEIPFSPNRPHCHVWSIAKITMAFSDEPKPTMAYSLEWSPQEVRRLVKGFPEWALNKVTGNHIESLEPIKVISNGRTVHLSPPDFLNLVTQVYGKKEQMVTLSDRTMR